MKYAIIFLMFLCLGSISVDKQTTSPIKKPYKVLFVFFDGINPSTQKKLLDDVAEFYGCNTLATRGALPVSAYYKPRNRYRADSLLKYLTYIKPDTVTKIIGWTSKDISATMHNIQDWGVVGLGQCPGKSCVVSSFRLKSDYKQYLSAALHEIGHTFGIPHCASPSCLMNDARGKISKAPAIPYMCKKCRAIKKG